MFAGAAGRKTRLKLAELQLMLNLFLAGKFKLEKKNAQKCLIYFE
jgi:hypothetical protein